MKAVLTWFERLCRTVLALGLAGAVSAQASGLHISPVGLAIAGQQRASALELQNAGGTPFTAQIRVFKWTQSTDGEEILTPTDALIASPPMVTLQRDAVQQVRIIRNAPAGAAEETFRVLIDEIPDPNVKQGKGLHFVLQYSVPVFLNSTDNPVPQLAWSVEAKAPSKPVLVIHNQGAVRAQLARIWVLPPSAAKHALSETGGGPPADSGAQNISEGLFGYVLPGATLRRELTLPLPTLREGRWGAVVNGRDTPVDVNFR